MRVISGSARGRNLLDPKDMKVRPTTDMVKEALFSIIQFRLEDARVLDMFAGTGQLGIEALSRGAAEAVFVDSAASSVKLVRENLARTGLEDGATVVCADACAYIGSQDQFDVIFVDPPYDTPLVDKALEAILRFDILRDDGIILCETKIDRVLPPLSGGYYVKKEYRYGKIKLTAICKRTGEDQENH